MRRTLRLSVVAILTGWFVLVPGAQAAKHEILGSANLTTTVYFSPATDFNVLADFEYHRLVGNVVQLGLAIDTALYPVSGTYQIIPQAAISVNFGGSSLNSQFFLRAMGGPVIDITAAGTSISVIHTSLAFGKRFQMFSNVSYAPSIKMVLPVFPGISTPYLVLELLAFSILF